MSKMFPVIDMAATGANILRLRKERGLSVRDLQDWFGFEEPQAIYKWQKGKSLPTVDNLYALGALLEVPMDQILVQRSPQLNIVKTGQQDGTCCPNSIFPALLNAAGSPAHVAILSSRTVRQPEPPLRAFGWNVNFLLINGDVGSGIGWQGLRMDATGCVR